jgi:hypothetical protein
MTINVMRNAELRDGKIRIERVRRRISTEMLDWVCRRDFAVVLEWEFQKSERVCDAGVKDRNRFLTRFSEERSEILNSTLSRLGGNVCEERSKAGCNLAREFVEHALGCSDRNEPYSAASSPGVMTAAMAALRPSCVVATMLSDGRPIRREL